MKDLRKTIRQLEHKVNCLCKAINDNTGGSGTNIWQDNGSGQLIPVLPFLSAYSRGGGNLDENTAYGQNALLSNTTGTSNTAFGDNAASLTTTGAAITAVGTDALKNNVFGAYLVAIGTSSMVNYVGPFNSQNAAVGAFSMYLSTTGIGNTAMGSSALQNHTTGNYNTAVGFHTLESRVGNLTGQFNIGLGVQAGRAVTTGSNNILIENTLNDGVTTGSRNIIINPINRCGITTGNNNVIIGGFNSVFAGTLTDHMIFGTGNGVERYRIDNNGNFAIGTTSPNASSILDISSTTKTLTIPRMNNAQQSAIVSPLQGSMIYNNQTYNNIGAFQFRDANGWFNVRRKDIVDLSVLLNPVIPTGTIRIFGTGGPQGLGGGTIQVNSNISSSYSQATGNYVNNTNESIILNVSGTITFNSAAWTQGQVVELGSGGVILVGRYYAPSTGTYVFTINFNSQIILSPGGVFALNIFQNSGSNKTINSTLSTRIIMST